MTKKLGITHLKRNNYAWFFEIKTKDNSQNLGMIAKVLKLIICYISSGATNIAEVSSGFHQADWSLFIVI